MPYFKDNIMPTFKSIIQNLRVNNIDKQRQKENNALAQKIIASVPQQKHPDLGTPVDPPITTEYPLLALINSKPVRDFLNGKDRDLSDEEYRIKYGYNKPIGSSEMLGFLVAPEWEGLEFPEITAMHYGLKGASKGTSAVETARFMNVPQKVNEVKSINNWQKFLQKSTQEKNDIVRMWNAERYSDFPQLERSKDLNKFINWLNKQ